MDHLASWSHMQGERSTPERKSAETKNAEFIEQVTGFHPRQLYSYAHKLEDEYRGQSWEPFLFAVDWIER